MAERLGATPQGRLRPRTSDETFCYASARFAHDGRVRPCILVDSAAHTRDSGRASSMKEFLLFSSLIYGSLFVGWVLRQWIPALVDHSRLILRFTIMAVSTPLILLVYWDMDATLFRTYFPIALAALVVLSVSGLAGYLITRLIGGDRAARGAFVVSSMFSNIGSILGGFLCMLYLGDEGLVVSQIFVLLTFPFYFTVVFAVARRFAGGAPMGIWQATRANFKDPLAGLPLMAVIVGLTLGLSGVAEEDPGIHGRDSLLTQLRPDRTLPADVAARSRVPGNPAGEVCSSSSYRFGSGVALWIHACRHPAGVQGHCHSVGNAGCHIVGGSSQAVSA